MNQDKRVSIKKVRQFKCKNCGGELELYNQRSQYVACPYCGSVADSSSDAYKVLTNMDKPSKFPPMSFIEIGMEGVFNDKVYKVIGRTRRRNNYKEYWAEDGETAYSDETWILDEWLLISEDATYLTIVEDSEGYTIANPIIPKYPSLPQGETMLDFYYNKPKQVQEYGQTEILYYEGESTYLVKTGDKSAFSEYSDYNSKSYSAEWRYKDNEVKEIEFFEETPISSSELIKAFNLPETTVANGKRWSFKLNIGAIFFITAAINLISSIIVFSIYTDVKEKRISESINLKKLEKTSGSKILNDTLREVVYNKKIKLEGYTKRIFFIFSQKIISDSLKCLNEVILLDDNRDTIMYRKGYSYNLRKDKKIAKKLFSTGADFKKDLDLKTIDIIIKMKVPKDKKVEFDFNEMILYQFSSSYLEDKPDVSEAPGLWFSLLLLLLGLVWQIGVKAEAFKDI